MGEERLAIEWKSFLLFPQSNPWGSQERFRAYTRSWQRPAEHEPRAGFREWSSDEGPPSHSVPPHLVAKAARDVDAEAEERLRWALFEAYFQRSRDITAEDVLRELWRDAGLPAGALEEVLDDEDRARTLIESIVADHREAAEHGVTGVPAVRRDGDTELVVGAQPTAVYRRLIG